LADTAVDDLNRSLPFAYLDLNSTSPDLVTWTNAGIVFTATGNLPPQSVLFAPKTVYNAQTKQWVLWFNYITESFSNSFYGVATSNNPAGPFTVVNKNVALQFQDNGDEGLFVDDDGVAYVIYTTLSRGHSISIERLSADYLSSLGANASSGIFGESFVEAPALFKRRGIYYAVFGSCCCYCGSGSQVSVYTATSALGPYTKRNVLGASPVLPTPLSAAPNGTVTAVLSAIYASNCGHATDLAKQATAACVGSANCTWSVCVENQPSCPPGSPNAIPDPDFGCEKDLSVSWTCSGDAPGTTRHAHLAAPAEGEWAEVSCYPAPPPRPIPFGSQQTDIFSYVDSNGEKQFMYVGDHWQSSPDGLKSHDFTVWAPLVFDATGNVSSPGFLESFTVDVGTTHE
jgi:Glycosyl hydrolases family 43